MNVLDLMCFFFWFCFQILMISIKFSTFERSHDIQYMSSLCVCDEFSFLKLRCVRSASLQPKLRESSSFIVFFFLFSKSFPTQFSLFSWISTEQSRMNKDNKVIFYSFNNFSTEQTYSLCVFRGLFHFILTERVPFFLHSL